MLQQYLISAFRDFFLMLNLPFPDEAEFDNPNDLIALARTTLENELAMGTKISQPEGIPHTPLMLYACLDITDERLTAELAKGKEYVTKQMFITLANQPMVSHKIVSAMTFALLFSNKNIAEILYRLNYFSTEDLQKNAYLATLMNSLGGIQFLLSKNVNLLRIMGTFSKNILHLACESGLTEITEAILASNPNEEELSRKTADGKDALTLAVEAKHHECAELFKGKKLYVWKQMMVALKEKDLRALIKEIDSNREMELWHGPYYERHLSLLGLAITLKIKDNDANSEAIYDHVQAYINRQPYSVQINSILLTLSHLRSMDANLFAEPINALHEDLLRLSPHYKQVDALIVNGYSLSDVMLNATISIILTSKIKKLDFALLHSGSLDDNNSSTVCTVNITMVIIAILSNTTLVECNGDFSPLLSALMIELLNTALERNKAMERESESTIKEWIFNRYINKINSLIKIIHATPGVFLAGLLKPLSPQHKAHSLQSFLTFSMANREAYQACQRGVALPPALEAQIKASTIPTSKRTPSLFLDLEDYLVRHSRGHQKSIMIDHFIALLTAIKNRADLALVTRHFGANNPFYQKIKFEILPLSQLKNIEPDIRLPRLLDDYLSELDSIPAAEKNEVQSSILDAIKLSDNTFYKLHLYLKNADVFTPNNDAQKIRKLNDFLNVISIAIPTQKDSLADYKKTIQQTAGKYSHDAWFIGGAHRHKYCGEFADLMSELYTQNKDALLYERKAYEAMFGRQYKTSPFTAKIYECLMSQRQQRANVSKPRLV